MIWTSIQKFSYILVNGLMANFEYEANLTKFLLTKLIFEVLHLLVKNPQFWSENHRIENLPIIYLPIYKKIFFAGSNSKIFINKVDFGQVAYLVKILQ